MYLYFCITVHAFNNLQLQQQQMQGNSQLPQQYMQHQLSSQSQNSNRSIQQHDKISGGIMPDGSMSNTSRGNDQVFSPTIMLDINLHCSEDSFSPIACKLPMK